VATRALAAELQTTGQIDFEQDGLAHVSPRIPGRVERVLADLGDDVRKGQELVVIDSVELGKAKADYLQARADEELARQNLEREQGLFAERISSEKEMLVARASHLESVARLRNAEETLHLYGLSDDAIRSMSYELGQTSHLPVRAPLAGRVVEKHVTVGELVTPEHSLFTIADLRHVWIWIDIYERDLGNVHLDDDVTLTVDAYPDATFGGQVTYVSDQVDPDTRTVRARIDVENPGQRLRPGMFARVRVSDPHAPPDTAPSGLVIPASAAQRDGEQTIVFVALGNRRFERRPVALGRKTSEFVEVLSGLAAGDEVVVQGAFLLKSEASKEQMGAGHAH
jgi:cobalt-zinc-cadmium efflux system membrane fusion protein